MQNKYKKGKNNLKFGIKKSEITIKKLQKLVYVYEADSRKLIRSYLTVECIKQFKLSKNTLYKY